MEFERDTSSNFSNDTNNNQSIEADNINTQSKSDAPSENVQQNTFSRIYTPTAQGYINHTSNQRGGYSENANMYSSYSSTPYGNTAGNIKKAPKQRLLIASVIVSAVVSVALLASVFLNFSLLAKVNHEISESKETLPENEIDNIFGTNSENNQLGISGSNSNKPSAEENKQQAINGEALSISSVVSLVENAVVEITTEHVVKDAFFSQYVSSGAGSGVIISSSGYVITNHHVIDGASSITVRLKNGKEYQASLIGSDAGADIAVIKITPKEDDELTVAKLGNSDNLLTGEEIIIIGNPLGSLGGTVTNGIISALDREITIDGENMTLLQTNAAVNPGNSGGGMFNLYGELVGVVNAKSSGSDIEGLGFAIPINTASDVSKQLMEYGYVKGRIDHGLSLIDIDDIYDAMQYRVNSLGVYVYESKYTDEIKNGDRIAYVNDIEVSTSAEIKAALKDCKVGDVVDITVVRGGKLVDTKLKLHEYVPTDSGDVSFQ